MLLARYLAQNGVRWSCDGKLLEPSFSLASLLGMPHSQIPTAVRSQVTDLSASGALLAPIEDRQDVWAGGVTYLRSREARKAESETGCLPESL